MKSSFAVSALVYAFLLFFVACSPKKTDRNRTVYIRSENGRYTLIKNGRPFFVRGAAGYTNLATLRQAGGNTIRTWDTLRLGTILKDAEQNGLSVIVGLDMPDNQNMDWFYNNRAATTALLKSYQKIVERYKNSPALLCWCLGNELPFPLKPSFYKFYQTFNDMVGMIHSIDPNHPVTTTVINFQPQNILNIKYRTDIDFISINIFGELRNLNQQLDKYKRLWDGPFMITEWGIDGPWLAHDQTSWNAYIEENSTKKAEQYISVYQKYMPVRNPRYLGSLVFYWGQKQETTPTWFSLFDREGNRSEAVNAMQYLWTSKKSDVKVPQIRYMLLNEKGSRDNIFLKPDSMANAHVMLNDQDYAKYSYEWQLMAEDWYQPDNHNSTKALKPIGAIQTGIGKTAFPFRVPHKEGAYRVYVYIRANNHTFATCNTPFYVLPAP